MKDSKQIKQLPQFHLNKERQIEQRQTEYTVIYIEKLTSILENWSDCLAERRRTQY